MPIERVIRGETFTSDAYFYQTDGITPLLTSRAASFVVRAPDGSVIHTGLGTQDMNSLQRWSAQVTISPRAPVTKDGERYQITWTAVSDSFTTSVVNHFTVSDEFNVDPAEDSTVLAVENMPFKMFLRCQYSYLQTLSLRITDFHGAVRVVAACDLVDVKGIPDGHGYIYPLTVTPKYRQLVALIQGVTPFLAYWNYTTPPDCDNPDGIQEVEIQQVIICSPLMVTLMDNVRRHVDRIRNRDFIPQLQVSQIDLANAVLQGYMMFNGYPPSNNGVFWPSDSHTPDQFLIFIQNCSCIKLLESMYLGEGMTAFNFGGQAVQLEMDRTQYIQTMIQMLEEQNQDARAAKNHYFRSGGRRGNIGAIGGAWGPTSNVIYRVSPLSLNSGFPILPFLR